jgi:hypothetical protein
VKQKTAKTVEDVLDWIETTPHHKAAWEDMPEPGFLVLSGHHDRLRIPTDVHARASRLVAPGDQFDTRMYRATKAGRARLARWRRKQGVAL